MSAKKDEKIIEFEPTGAAQKTSRVSVFLVVLLVASWVGIGVSAYYFWYLPQQMTKPAVSTDALRFAELERELQELKSNIAAPQMAANTEAVAGVEQKVGGLESRILSLEAAELAQKKEVHSTALIALLSVQDRVAKGDPYAVELGILSTLLTKDVGATPYIATLSAHAEKAVPTIQNLESRFADLARDILTAEYKNEDTVLARIKRSLSHVITIRKIDGKGNARDNTLASAEQALKERNINKATQALSALQGKEKEVVAPWLADAQSLSEIEEALKNLSLRLRSQVVTGRTPAAEMVLPEPLNENKEGAPTPNKDKAP